MMEGVLC